jgi:hypothetical protein
MECTEKIGIEVLYRWTLPIGSLKRFRNRLQDAFPNFRGQS